MPENTMTQAALAELRARKLKRRRARVGSFSLSESYNTDDWE